MKQTFIIETSDGLTEIELLGCLEDTLGKNHAWSVEEVKNKMKTKYNYQKTDKPLSFRVPLNIHKGYKELSSFGRKQVQYKFNLWIKRQIESIKEVEE